MIEDDSYMESCLYPKVTSSQRDPDGEICQARACRDPPVQGALMGGNDKDLEAKLHGR